MKFKFISQKFCFIGIAILLLPISIHSEESKKILILGDSISAGYGVQLKTHWVQILQDHYKTIGKKITLINASISGDTTGGGLSRIDGLLSETSPDYVLLELGGNDGLRGYPIKRIKENLENICKIIKVNNIPIGLMQIRLPPNYGDKYITAFENIYVDISADNQIILLPFVLEEIALNNSLMQPDGIHPNESAQARIAKYIEVSIELLLKEV